MTEPLIEQDHNGRSFIRAVPPDPVQGVPVPEPVPPTILPKPPLPPVDVSAVAP
jgi:hypothetical protein